MALSERSVAEDESFPACKGRKASMSQNMVLAVAGMCSLHRALVSFPSLLSGNVLGFTWRHLRDATCGAPQATGELSRANLRPGGKNMLIFTAGLRQRCSSKDTPLSSENLGFQQVLSIWLHPHPSLLTHSHIQTHTSSSLLHLTLYLASCPGSHLLWLPCPHHN